MKYNGFQNNSHSPQEKENPDGKVVPFERKRGKAHPQPEQSAAAQIIAFPNRPARGDNPPKSRSPLFWLETLRSSRLLGLIILFLILALLLTL